MMSREEWAAWMIQQCDKMKAGLPVVPLPEPDPEPEPEANVTATPSGREGHVKVYPDLGAACLRARLDRPYRLWLLMRPAHEGRGRWTLEDAYERSVGTRRQTRAWLKAGMGIFWMKTRTGRYELVGLGKLSASLGTPPDKHAAYVPEEHVKSLALFRAVTFAAWFTSKPVTITQAKLGELFGRKPRTIQRWQKLAGLDVGHNLAWTSLADHEDLAEKAATVGAAYYWTETWDGPPGKRRKRGDKPEPMTALVWPLPCTYRSPYERAAKTRLQRHAAYALSKLAANRGPAVRVFCPRGPGQARQAARLIEAGGMAFVEEARAHHGYGLWERCAHT